MSFDLTPLRVTWAALALVGAVFALWSGVPGPRGADWAGIVALAVWCLTETMVRRNWVALLALPALGLGLGVALPLYLLVRSARIR